MTNCDSWCTQTVTREILQLRTDNFLKHINFFNIIFLPLTQNTSFWIPRKMMCLISWERTQKGTHICDSVGLVQGPKTPQNRKYEKNTEKLQNPPPSGGPRKYDKVTKKMQKNVNYLYVFGNFVVFSGGPTQGGGFCNFSYFFRISGLGGFLGPVRAQRNCKPT